MYIYILYIVYKRSQSVEGQKVYRPVYLTLQLELVHLEIMKFLHVYNLKRTEIHVKQFGIKIIIFKMLIK